MVLSVGRALKSRNEPLITPEKGLSKGIFEPHNTECQVYRKHLRCYKQECEMLWKKIIGLMQDG